jgi:hypothetical protein
VKSGSRRRGGNAAFRTGVPPGARVASALLLFLLAGLVPAGCRRAPEPAGTPPPTPGTSRTDALFLSEAPAFIPDESEADLTAMGIARLYVVAATLGRDGTASPAPPPPAPLKRPIVLVLMGAEGAASALTGRGPETGAEWARAVARVLSDSKSWGRVAGVHVHLWPTSEQAKDLAAALAALKKSIGGAPVSVTLPATGEPTAWKPLAGAADEALVFAFGRRPELGGRIVSEMPEENARVFPIPFRLLVAFGSYGRAGDGASFDGPMLADGKIDELSEDRGLDFEFGQQVFSSEPGTVYTFKPRPGARSSLSSDGGWARFQVPTLAEGLRSLAGAGRWSAPKYLGRVFLVGGVPTDGSLIGYPAVRALLTGKPLEPRLSVDVTPAGAGPGWTEFTVASTNTGPAPTDLSHYNSWVQIRVEGGTIASVRAGDFDRYEQLTSEAEGLKPTTSSRAVVCRLFENLFAAGEVDVSGTIRIAGARPRAYASWRLAMPDGKVITGKEVEIPLAAPPAPKAAPSKRR